ncbi:MAG: hypothetical protein V4650_06215 [Pseudomonadota bacterium]
MVRDRPTLFSSGLRVAALTLLGIGLAACGGGSGNGDSGLPQPLGDIAQPVQPAVPNAPYAKVLGDCVFNPQRSSACLLSTLPFLGQDSSTVTVDQVMERVAVTHPWMATRFREALQAQPAALLQMTRSTTAIIIGSKVRPSFYYAATGAIYLDPDTLWLTQAEHDTIDKTPDARIAFGRDLQFRAIWRYVKDNDYAYPFYASDYRGSRTLEDTRIALGRLLVHELTHASDFSPPAGLASLPRNQTVEAAITSQSSQWISTRLTRSDPLRSSAWLGLAQVLYADRTPNATEKNYSPAQAGALVEPDRASDAYGYFTQYEDAAMLAEELLAYCFYGVQRDFATSNRPAAGQDFVVGWGQRGRIAESQVLQAARFVVQEALPGVAFESCYSSLPAPVRLRAGATWTANLNPSGSSTKSVGSGGVIRTDDLLPPG